MSIIQITNLSFAYVGGKEIFSNVSFNIDSAWKLDLIGRNGRGKSTLLKLLCGAHKYYGTISAGEIKFAYFPFSVEDESQNGLCIAERAARKTESWKVIRECNLLGITDEMLSRPFRTLSGGERAKILIASLFADENNFPLLDEPTNNLDARSTKAVEKYLSAKKRFYRCLTRQRFSGRHN